MLLRHAIGSVLRRLRTERGATLREVSERSRISVPYLSEIERGRKEASSEILAALCRVLDLGEGQLMALVAAEFADSQVLSLVGSESPQAAAAAAPAPGHGLAAGAALLLAA